MAKKEDVHQYIQALKKEIKLVIPLLEKNRKISQIHYGGGTPNSIPVNYINEINQLFFDSFEVIDNPEIAIECHPAYLNRDYVDKLKKAGFTRFSLGIQDFDRNVLKAMNRDPSMLPLGELTGLIREGENTSVNFDFIYGLPYQTKSSFLKTISKAIEIKPERLVTFSYAHVPWINKAQLVLEKKGLPIGEEKIDMTESAYNLLEENGYKSIGMDHYVLKSDALYSAQQSENLHRNFQGYCTRETTGQVYAFGVSGISQLSNGYAQNTKSVPQYIEAINSGSFTTIKGYQLTSNESIIKDFLTHFMCNKGINWSTMADRLNICISDLKKALMYNNTSLVEFQNDGIVLVDEDSIKITEDGLPFIRNVAASFDPLLKNTNRTFSKAV
jgi:oxygen-independent coproporphyrinogen-3 oxidase